MMTSANRTFPFGGPHVRLRTSWVLPMLALGLSAVALGCSSDSKGTRKNLCEASQIDGCNAACSQQSPCKDGLYCENGKCSAECQPVSVAVDCGSNATCSSDGHCVTNNSGMDGGPSGDGEGNGDGDHGGGNVDGSVCGSLDLKPTPTIPNVLFIIDQSGSMDEKFDPNGGDHPTRWEALKLVLLGDDTVTPKVVGLLEQIEGSVDFGVALYSADSDHPELCPQVTTVNVAANNLAQIRAVYGPAKPLDDTPTGDSIEKILASKELTDLVKEDRPTIFILATDGNPDRCEAPDSDAQSPIEAVNAVKHAYMLGIQTYVLAVADEADIAQKHVQDLANAGKGVKPGDPDAPSFRVTSVDALKSTLTGIVTGQLSCTVPLKGKITTSSPCDDGTVTLDGTKLKCDDANGWSLSGDSAIEIKGTACDKLKAGGTLTADFKCGSAVVL